MTRVENTLARMAGSDQKPGAVVYMPHILFFVLLFFYIKHIPVSQNKDTGLLNMQLVDTQVQLLFYIELLWFDWFTDKCVRRSTEV